MSDEEIYKLCLFAPTKRAIISQFANTFNLQRGKDTSVYECHYKNV